MFEETSAYLIVKCYNVENCVLNLCDEYCTNLEKKKDINKYYHLYYIFLLLLRF